MQEAVIHRLNHKVAFRSTTHFKDRGRSAIVNAFFYVTNTTENTDFTHTRELRAADRSHVHQSGAKAMLRLADNQHRVLAILTHGHIRDETNAHAYLRSGRERKGVIYRFHDGVFGNRGLLLRDRYRGRRRKRGSR